MEANEYYLAEYMRGLDHEHAYDRAIDARVAEIMSGDITADDVYELAEMLTRNDAQQQRERLAELFRIVQRRRNHLTLEVALVTLGESMEYVMDVSRKERALNQAIDEESRK